MERNANAVASVFCAVPYFFSSSCSLDGDRAISHRRNNRAILASFYCHQDLSGMKQCTALFAVFSTRRQRDTRWRMVLAYRLAVGCLLLCLTFSDHAKPTSQTIGVAQGICERHRCHRHLGIALCTWITRAHQIRHITCRLLGAMSIVHCHRKCPLSTWCADFSDLACDQALHGLSGAIKHWKYSLGVHTWRPFLLPEVITSSGLLHCFGFLVCYGAILCTPQGM